MLQATRQTKDLTKKSLPHLTADERKLRGRWLLLCESYLPVKSEESIWRYSRNSKPQEPSQGWKLHISATILEACDLFERVAPYLISRDIQFKAPGSLDELSKLNCGLQYGYHQVGKFITIYPKNESEAVKIAQQLDELTGDFFSISVPFDERYAPDSSVFYRYGGFSNIKITGQNGEKFSAIKNPAGEFVLDDRKRAIPQWLSNPFPDNKTSADRTFRGTALEKTYRVFRAATQRGKGGTYEAVNLSGPKPQLCVVKEGRKNGELGWNGQDGFSLVKNEFDVLTKLQPKFDAVPQVFESFEINGNFYFAMEYVEGKNLNELMQPRRRRFSISQILKFAVDIAQIIEKIHQAGWIWNDCKPSNIVVTKNKTLRPIDFEGAYKIDEPEPFDWKTVGFSRSKFNSNLQSAKSNDFYALGAVLYFLLTGRFYDSDNLIQIKKLRRNVPQKFIDLVNKLLSENDFDFSNVRNDFEKLLKSI